MATTQTTPGPSRDARPVMPHDRDEYERMRTADPRPGPCCSTTGPAHWPLFAHCGGGNGPGRPIRPHCTCDACF
jgi:hypothetical protein